VGGGGWGFGGWGPRPNPQSPIPNPQSPIPMKHKNKIFEYEIKKIFFIFF